MPTKHAPMPVLPDLLRPGLSIVFCGTAAGPLSAARGAYYAHPQNKFWKTLYAVGLTPRLLEPCEFPLLSQWGMGLTDIAKHCFGLDKDLPRGSLGRDACAELRIRIDLYQPKILAFTSLNAGRHFLGGTAGLGIQTTQIGFTDIWILPSPSPAAYWHWDERWWLQLARACTQKKILETQKPLKSKQKNAYREC